MSEKQTFATGAQRDTQGSKLRYDLMSPLADMRLTQVFTHGAEKYGDRNWEKGIPFLRMVASAKRHLQSFLMGEVDEDHLAQATWNLYALLHFDEAIGRGLLPATLDDRQVYQTLALPDEGSYDAFADALHRIFNGLDAVTPIGEEKESPTTLRDDTDPHAAPSKLGDDNCRDGKPRKKKKIYIAGPMRGYPEFNFPAFDAAKTLFATAGWVVISPADIDRTQGFTTQRGYAKRDCEAILDCDAVYMLRGWSQSVGATAEHALAVWAELEIFYQEA